DTGMGILAAAKALGLDFLPLAEERYDIIIPQEFIEDDKIAKLLKIIRSGEFKGEVNKLGGYDVRATGETIWRSSL
ncbi:MAG: molybdopterin biosynthesis protein, partial [Candidatus Syntrophonatronum acetioxidans]